MVRHGEATGRNIAAFVWKGAKVNEEVYLFGDTDLKEFMSLKHTAT